VSHVGVLQHFACENAGAFGKALCDERHQITIVKLFDGQPVPPPDAFDAWIVMGGLMNVDETDRYSYLGPERQLLMELIQHDRPVMGICLGAQLIARAAGAAVYPQRPKEIGLYPIMPTKAAASDPLFELITEPMEVFQWHGDTFDLPQAAVHLARSDRFDRQAFRLGRRVYGLQFHLECTAQIVDDLRRACAEELAALPPEDRFEKFDGRLALSLERQNAMAREMILRWLALLD